MSWFEAFTVVFLIALSVSFLLRGAWKKARSNREECCRGRCGCAVSKKAAAARR